MKVFYAQYYTDDPFGNGNCDFVFGIYSHDTVKNEVKIEFKLPRRKLKKYCNKLQLSYKAVKIFMNKLPSDYKFEVEHGTKSFKDFADEHINNFRFKKID